MAERSDIHKYSIFNLQYSIPACPGWALIWFYLTTCCKKLKAVPSAGGGWRLEVGGWRLEAKATAATCPFPRAKHFFRQDLPGFAYKLCRGAQDHLDGKAFGLKVSRCMRKKLH
jgi:hypothetical protein